MKRFYLSVVAILIGLSATSAYANFAHRPWFVGVEGGYSISTPMDFKPDYDVALPSRSWIVPASSSFDRLDMNTSPLLGALVGYQINPIINFDLNYTYRWDYCWDHDFSLDDLTPTDIRTVGERYVLNNIRVQTLLLEMKLIPKTCWGGIQPFGTIGAGMGWITTGALRNYDLPHAARNIEQTFDIYLQGKTKSSFAWDVGAGLDYCITPCLHLTVGYRFVDIRKMKTTGNARDSFRFPQAPDFTIQPFKARHVQFHEPFVGLNIYL